MIRTYTPQDLSRDQLQSIVADLEAREIREFDYYQTVKSEFPGEQWSHLTEPLERRWRETEHALAMVRCGL